MAAPATQSITEHLWTYAPSHWPAQQDLLQWCHDMGPAPATLLVLSGIIYLFFGYNIFKWLVTINGAVLFAFIGAAIGEKFGSAPAGAILGGITAGALTWLFMKWSVAVMGGLYGAVLGGFAWTAAGLDQNFVWAGATIGLVFFGLLSFILFRVCIIFYMSLQGSTMLIFGLLALICKYQNVSTQIVSNLKDHPFILPITLFVPMLLAIIYQQNAYPPQATGGKK